MMDELQVFVEFALRGLLIGALYSLMALGLSLIFGVMRVINVAHGEFLMIGGYVAYFAWAWTQLSPLATLLISVPALFALGVALERFLVERVVGKPELASLMLTFGISITLWNLAHALFSPDPRSVPYLYEPLELLGIYISKASLMIFAASLGLAALLVLFLKGTRWGKAIRAVAQNPEVAQACGIDTRRVRMLAFGLGAGLAGAAGTFVPIQFSLFPGVGHEFILKAFAVVVLGGLGSLGGAFTSGLLLGVVESLITFYANAHVAYLTFYATIVGVLLLRPAGLFGTGLVEED